MRDKLRVNRFFGFALMLFWLKTYVVSRYYFDLEVETWYQELILVLGPLSAGILFFGLGLLVADRFKNLSIVVTSFVLSVVMYANVMFYRFFTDFLTLPVLFQTDNAGDLGGSAFELMNGWDMYFFVDFVIVWLIYRFKRPVEMRTRRGSVVKLTCVAAMIFVVNVMLAEVERPELLSRTFDRSLLVKNIGLYNYQMYDVLLQAKTKAHRVFADGKELAPINEKVVKDSVSPSENMRGIAKGKNVVVISMESLQSFVIDNKVEGKTITPYLNKLKRESYYFPNFYHQTAQGKTSDSEFLLENSLYPLPSGSVFFTHATNEFDGMPGILADAGYSTSVQHANASSFWNRDVMYPKLGYQKFFDVDSFEVTSANSVGWGLKDKEFFEQSLKNLDELEKLNKPYYTKYITLTNHFPFTLNRSDERIPAWDSGDGTVDRYFTTVNYMDYAIEEFMKSLKDEKKYKDTVFVMYGDHYGISDNHNEAMEKYLGREIDEFEHVELQKVPLLIHIPGQKGKVMKTVGGQIDLKPTILNLLGVDTTDRLMFGHDLFSKDRKDLVIMRDGTFVTDRLMYRKGVCYEKKTREELTDGSCDVLRDETKRELEFSDQVIYGDLLRFMKDGKFSNTDSESLDEMESEKDVERRLKEESKKEEAK